ncbi:type IV secretory system conjugative DNA transfer family protein [Sphingobium sp. CFD-2]|uniref:type IV secretory system conjugative DNA transfer family protein n=1 Tax=Sphingobium sp. CFD-2 TaxID=2878542 RepID=UPI0035A30C86
MAGPLIGGRRPISWRLAIVVAFVAAYATARWLEGIFGVGQISGTVSFLVLVGLIGATWWINSRGANRRNELLGSARFGDRADVRKLEASGDLLIGRGKESGKLLHYDGAAHLLTIAPTRSGKGVGTIIPNLLLLDRSVVCIDPKGENARVTARARASKGAVWCLDPFGVSGRPAARYNPLAQLDPASPDLAEDAQTIADALVHDAPGQSGEAHWNEAQSARSCDFGHLGEHVGNGLVVVDDRPCEERRSAPIRERRYEPWRFEWGSDRLLEPEFFGHRVRDRQSGDGTTGIGGSA